MASTSLAAILEPDYARDLAALPIEEIRRRRDQATEIEVGLSFARRMVQGRLDIVLAEIDGRSAAERGDRTGPAGAPGQPEEGGGVSALVERLPEILGNRVLSPGTGRLPTLMAPAEADLSAVTELDEIVDADALATLSRRSDAELHGVATALSGFERQVSDGRRSVHEVIDRLQDELVRRYKTGEASVDTLLS